MSIFCNLFLAIYLAYLLYIINYLLISLMYKEYKKARAVLNGSTSTVASSRFTSARWQCVRTW